MKKIAIIGGGVAGLGPAWLLARRGWEVELFEREQVGAGASTKAGGMLAPVSEVTFEEDDLLQLGLFSHSLYPRFISELEEESGLSVDYRTEGTLLVAIDRDDAEKLEHLYQFQRRLGLNVERLDAAALRELEPGLSPTINYGLFAAGDHHIDPVLLIAALKEAFLKAGGTLHENCAVQQIACDDEVRGLHTPDGTFHEFSKVLIAAGAWSRKIEGLGPDVLPHVRPIRGQMLAVELGTPPLLRHILRAPDAYLVPKSDGRLLIGSTMEERGFDTRQTAGGLMDLLDGAFEALPGIYDASVIDTWSGLRPVTLANLPALGESRIKGLFLALGHGRNGILLTPATAYGLADLIDNGQVHDRLAPFLVDGPNQPA